MASGRGGAALRVVLRVGLDGVTVRGIATEAGWSTGSLRHYFANQHELQAYVMTAATEMLRDRMLPRVQRPRTSGSAVDRVVSIVAELLPLDAQRREEYALWVAVTEWERRHPPAGGSRTWRDQRALHRQCVAALRGQPTTSRIEDAGLPPPRPGGRGMGRRAAHLRRRACIPARQHPRRGRSRDRQGSSPLPTARRATRAPVELG
ncbi:TetR/AcrR family transcriptional regulator [Occultella kanbiaonis]|uniref:TetR/AcrR family transcriptional regulator n=1 Tax=Occultella kanbiaonis TaxID=2675754 RepID=UPI0013D543F0